MTEHWKEVYGTQKSPEYMLGRVKGLIVETPYKDYSECQQIIDLLNERCKGTFSVGLQPGYSVITFRFFEEEDKDFFLNFLKNNRKKVKKKR